MKRTYEKPMAEKIQFDYSAQVVASGEGGGSETYYYNNRTTGCYALFFQGCASYPMPIV